MKGVITHDPTPSPIDLSLIAKDHDQLLSQGLMSSGSNNSERLLSHYQWSAVNLLCYAYGNSFIQDDFMPSFCGPDLSIGCLVNGSRFLVRRLINFAKTLTDFSCLQQDCQVSLLKGAVMDTLVLLSARYYDCDKDVWHTPKGEIPSSILKIATGLNCVYEEHRAYCRGFQNVTSGDPNIIALMQVMCLFSPDRPSLEARQIVAGVHDRYCLLLKHYLEAKFGFAKGRLLLADILTNMGQLEALTTTYGRLVMCIDTKDLDPLLTEMLNLIPHFQQPPPSTEPDSSTKDSSSSLHEMTR